jgi:hypothetical protein
MNKQMLLLAAIPACTFALAQSAPPYPGNLEMHQAGAASYMCGGIGESEQQAIKSQAGKHNMMLTFAVSDGAYLADVDVQIKDKKGGVVLSAKCEGPMMLVDLPSAGTWQVTAQVNGQARQKTVVAGAGRKAQATFIWPTDIS